MILLKKYKLKNKAISNIKIQQVLDSIGLKKEYIYETDLFHLILE